MAALSVISLGQRDYAEMAAFQETLVFRRLAGEIGDVLLILEHPPTYTLGRRAEPSDLLHDDGWYRQRGIVVRETPRGGKVTYHGPGQLVVYPVVDLSRLGRQPVAARKVDIRGFVEALERSMSETLQHLGITSGSIEGLTGLWVDDDRKSPRDFTGAQAGDAAAGLAAGRIRKIGSIGLKIHRGISSHGLSLNVSCDLDPFDWINSCGIESCRATSIETELGRAAPPVGVVGGLLADRIADNLDLELRPGDPYLAEAAATSHSDSVA